MKLNRIVFTALALGFALPAIAEAQQQPMVYRVQRRGMLGFASEQITRPDGSVVRVVVDVVKDSPAEKAGIIVGDTLVRFNGLQPRAELLAAFEPGDTVNLRLRRGGRDRNISVVATQRTQTFDATFNVLPDSIRKSIAIMMDRVRSDLDTITFPRLRIERINGDSTFVYLGPDRMFAFPPGFRGEIRLDSLRKFMLRPGEMSHLFGDSARIRIWTDTVGGFGRGSMFRWQSGDSAGVHFFTPRPGDRTFTFGRDSTMNVFMRPGEMVTGSWTMGMRAIAGAELYELNPSLGEQFGALEGVLVLNAAEGTPAAKSGLRAGDVIVSAAGQPVTSISALRQRVERARPGSTIRLEVLRRGARTSVDLQRQ